MLIFWPTSAFSSVDLPTLGRPTMATRPASLLLAVLVHRGRQHRGDRGLAERGLDHPLAAGPPHAVVFETQPIAFALRDIVPGTDLASVAQPGIGAAIWLHATDVQAIHDAFVADGHTIVSAPIDGPFGRTFTFADPGGQPGHSPRPRLIGQTSPDDHRSPKTAVAPSAEFRPRRPRSCLWRQTCPQPEQR